MNFNDLNNIEFENVDNKPSTAWLVSLSDLICLVLTFFVMMYSTKDIGEDKISEVRDSFVSYLGGQEMVYFENTQGQDIQNKIISKAEPLANVENLLISILNEENNLGVFYKIYPHEMIIWLEQEKLPKDLSKSFNDSFFVISKLLNSINNQIEVSSQGLDSKNSDIVANFMIKKFKELGYNNNMLITLPQRKIITENLEKDKNKTKIQIIIKDYESVI